MSYPGTRNLVVTSLIGSGAREAQTNSGFIDRLNFPQATSVLFCLECGSGATTISASRIQILESELTSTIAGGTDIASATTSGLTFTASGIIGLEMDLRNRARFLVVELSTPNVATSGTNGVFAILSDNAVAPPGASVDGFLNIRRVGETP